MTDHFRIRARAIEWMRTHKTAVDAFERLSKQRIDKRKKFGINQIREEVRREVQYDYSKDGYKFCNDFSPYVARYLLWKHPDWKAFMVCKQAKDEKPGEIIYITDREIGWHEPDRIPTNDNDTSQGSTTIPATTGIYEQSGNSVMLAAHTPGENHARDNGTTLATAV